MDAFAVAICKGLSLKKLRFRDALTVGIWFGVFQALMPLIGYFLGIGFEKYIKAFDHWIAFVLLSLVGASMIKNAFSKKEEETDDSLGFKKMLALAVSTSIDALAVGVSFAFLNINIVPAISFIGLITMTLSALGVKIGNVFGLRFKSKAELIGGIILILTGVKILIEHLFDLTLLF